MSRVQKRNLVLAAGAVLVLLAVYLFLLRANYLAEHQDDGRTVYTLESEQIERLEFTGKEGKVALVRREDGWKYEADESFPLNERFIETMLEKTSVLKAKSRVVKGRNYFEQYGLNTPSNVIRIDAETEQKVIFLGNINNTTGDSYMYVEGSDQIYSVDATFANLFSTGIYEMASRETLPNMTLDTIIGLEIRTGSTDIMFTKGESIRSTSGESCWNLLWVSEGALPFTVLGSCLGASLRLSGPFHRLWILLARSPWCPPHIMSSLETSLRPLCAFLCPTRSCALG